MAAQNKWSNPDGASFVNFALKANSIQYENVGCLFGACKAYYSTHKEMIIFRVYLAIIIAPFQKSISAKKIILKHSKDFNGTLNDSECCKLVGISRNTFYKYKAELRAELQFPDIEMS